MPQTLTLPSLLRYILLPCVGCFTMALRKRNWNLWDGSLRSISSLSRACFEPSHTRHASSLARQGVGPKACLRHTSSPEVKTWTWRKKARADCITLTSRRGNTVVRPVHSLNLGQALSQIANLVDGATLITGTRTSLGACGTNVQLPLTLTGRVTARPAGPCKWRRKKTGWAGSR